ncbi:hypothetical protein BDV18DRAFT_156742 [Aspergillus unguis]
MTRNSPDEALHFRGKTLTPESPRPVHVPEPTSIPVLQNQMDPVFNDTSTYGQAEKDSYGNGYQALANGQYNGRPDDARWNTSSGQGGQEQQPSQHQSHIQGSLQSGPFSMNHGLSGTNATSHPNTASTALSPNTIPSTRPSNVREATADSSLTTFPSPDPSSLLTHPAPGAHPSSPSTARSNPFANEVDHSNAALQNQTTSQGQLEEGKYEDNHAGNGVDFQNLLDNLPASSTSSSSHTVPGSAIPADKQAVVDEGPQTSPGLPPRPPPQEKPSIHPNYNPSHDIRSYHQLPTHAATNAPNPYASQQSNYQSGVGLQALAAGPPGTSSGTGSLPPPPVASFQQSSAPAETREPSSPATQRNGRADRQPLRSHDDAPWGPEVQKKYDAFLHDERTYVTEGMWDRFPVGSRLFVGNLPTERVTKRDLFHIFHSYGKLAQISIKQAYGFIQFLEAESCKKALDCQQNSIILKSQNRNETLNQGRRPQRPHELHPGVQDLQSMAEADLQATGRQGLRQIATIDLTNHPGCPLAISGMRCLTVDVKIIALRDHHLLVGIVQERDIGLETGLLSGLIGVTDGGHARHMAETGVFAVRALGVAGHTMTQTCLLPGDLLEMCQMCRSLFWRNSIETCFRNRNLRVDVLVLGPRIPLDAAVKRQISEGVLAVVRLSRPSQVSRKIPLQVLDRSLGANDVRSNEYPDVEPSIAAEIVCQAQSLKRNAPLPSPTYGVLPAPIPHAAPALAGQPNIANAISHLDGSGLQSLLAALQPRPPAVPAQQPFPAANPPAPDLASLLSAATRQPVPLNNPQPSLPQQPFPLQGPNTTAISDPNLMSLLAKGLGGNQSQGQPAMSPHQVQSLINQLGKWKQ